MTCIICGADFRMVRADEPRYSCDCGANVSRADWREMDSERFAALKAAWDAHEQATIQVKR